MPLRGRSAATLCGDLAGRRPPRGDSPRGSCFAAARFETPFEEVSPPLEVERGEGPPRWRRLRLLLTARAAGMRRLCRHEPPLHRRHAPPRPASATTRAPASRQPWHTTTTLETASPVGTATPPAGRPKSTRCGCGRWARTSPSATPSPFGSSNLFRGLPPHADVQDPQPRGGQGRAQPKGDRRRDHPPRRHLRAAQAGEEGDPQRLLRQI